jgi:hypothetical protein
MDTPIYKAPLKRRRVTMASSPTKNIRAITNMDKSIWAEPTVDPSPGLPQKSTSSASKEDRATEYIQAALNTLLKALKYRPDLRPIIDQLGKLKSQPALPTQPAQPPQPPQAENDRLGAMEKKLETILACIAKNQTQPKTYAAAAAAAMATKATAPAAKPIGPQKPKTKTNPTLKRALPTIENKIVVILEKGVDVMGWDGTELGRSSHNTVYLLSKERKRKMTGTGRCAQAVKTLLCRWGGGAPRCHSSSALARQLPAPGYLACNITLPPPGLSGRSLVGPRPLGRRWWALGGSRSPGR